MCMLVAEIMMLLGGLYALIAGKLKLTNSLQLEGTRARIAGIFLALPLPLALLTGFVIGILIEFGSISSEVYIIATIIEFVLVLGGLLGAFIYARATQPSTNLPAE